MSDTRLTVPDLGAAIRDAIARRDARIAAFLSEPCCRCSAAPCACPEPREVSK